MLFYLFEGRVLDCMTVEVLFWYFEVYVYNSDDGL